MAPSASVCGSANALTSRCASLKTPISSSRTSLSITIKPASAFVQAFSVEVNVQHLVVGHARLGLTPMLHKSVLHPPVESPSAADLHV